MIAKSLSRRLIRVLWSSKCHIGDLAAPRKRQRAGQGLPGAFPVRPYNVRGTFSLLRT